MNRRQFLRKSMALGGAAALAGTCYGVFESGWLRVEHREFALPHLPDSFHGTRVAFLTDIHHGPYTELRYIESIVRTVNLLEPDVILHGGDYSLRDPKYIAPVFEMLAQLRAPMGSFGVLGNHDYWHGLEETRDGMKLAKIEELTNRGVKIRQGGDVLHVTGVDDLWCGRCDADRALADVRQDHAVLMLSHNPDYIETLEPQRAAQVGLALSGHTHGGQVVFPTGLAPFVPSRYGQKYLHGLVKAPHTQVYVSRGLGMSMIPARLGSRPEITVITLV